MLILMGSEKSVMELLGGSDQGTRVFMRRVLECNQGSEEGTGGIRWCGECITYVRRVETACGAQH